ncbi:MAG TPA: putative Ig domain-containing protein [Micromonosporaceae bacterium]|nr:putative Ig domain-containing protein [Micromonosporaceae bacterium]
MYSFTVDLGTARPITQINSTWLQAKNDFVVLPTSVTYATSADGESFQPAATIDRPAVGDANQTKTYRAVGLDVTARYIKIELDGSDVWTMLDETEIRGTGNLVSLSHPGAQASTANVAVSRPMIADGGTLPYTWSATDLPAGVSIDATSGVVSGTPTVVGTAVPTVTVTDAERIARTVAFTWAVVTPVVVYDGMRLSSVVGQPESTKIGATVHVSGGTGSYTWSATGLPQGLSIDPATGVVSGTPTTVEKPSTRVTVSDISGSSASTTVIWDVANALVMTAVNRSSLVNVPLSVQLTATGGAAPYTWIVYRPSPGVGHSLPTGLTLNSSTGVITGTPTEKGVYFNIQVAVFDGVWRVADVAFDWIVRDPIDVTTTPAGDTKGGLVGRYDSVQPSATGGTAPYIWTANGLPAGISIDSSTGLMSGTPSTAQDTTVTVTASDIDGVQGTSTFTWDVDEILTHNPWFATGPSAEVSRYVTFSAPYIITIRDLTQNYSVGSCPAQQAIYPDSCTYFGLPYKATGTHTFQATMALPDGTDVQAVTTWTYQFPVTTINPELQRQSHIEYPGAAYEGADRWISTGAVRQMTLQANTDRDVNASPYTLDIVDVTTSETVASCGSGRFCKAVITDARAGHRFDAVLTDQTTTIDRYPLLDGAGADFSALTLNVTYNNGVIEATTNRRLGSGGFSGWLNKMELVGGGLYYDSDVEYILSLWYVPSGWGRTYKTCTTTSCTWRPDGNFPFAKPGYEYAVRVGDVMSTPRMFSLPTPPPLTASQTQGGQNPSMPASQVCSCDPVNTATGEFFDAATDIALPGKGPALGVTRTYSSTAATVDGPLGRGWSMNYAASLELLGTSISEPSTVTVKQETGSTVTFHHAGNRRYTAPQNVFATLVQETNGTWTFTRRAQQTMTFSSTGQLTSLKDLHGNTVTFTYNAGLLSSASTTDGRTITFTWTGTHLSAVSDSAGRTTTYDYDTAGHLVKVTAVDSAVTRYGYDTAHRIVLVTQPGGGFLRNTYDSSGRVTRQIDPMGQTTTLAYSQQTDGSSSTTVTAPGGAVTVSSFTNGYLTEKTTAAGTPTARLWRYGHDAAGNATSITDPLGKVVTSTFDATGNQTRQVDALSRTTTWTYNALNQVTATTDPTNRTTTYAYNLVGDLLSTTSPDARVEQRSYNTDGTVATHTAPNGAVTHFGYNTAGQRTTMTTTDGRTTTTEYNAAGLPVATTDPAGHTTRNTLDTIGRVLTVTDPANRTTRYAYNAAGHRTTVTDPAGKTTTTGYDLLGRPTTATDPTGATTTTTYTASGQVATTTDPTNKTTTHQYNALGELASITDAANRTVTFTYDLDGRPLTTTLPSGAHTSTTYDAAGQVTSSTDANGKTTTYDYDPAGRLSSTTDPLGRIARRTYTGDALAATVVAPDSGTTTYSYNANAQLTKQTDPDGHDTTYTYNAVGQQTTRTQPGGLITGYTYDPAGRPLTTTTPDGETITASYNTAGDITGIGYSAANTPDVTYTHDAAGRRASMTDGTGTTTYTHDAAGRLTASTDGAGATVAYGYDQAGRLTTLTYPGGNKVTYGYDNAGQMTSATDWAERTTTFGWDSDGRLATQQTPNGVISNRAYEPAGQTKAITLTKATTTLDNFTYTYDHAGQLNADAQHSYTFGTAGRLATVSGPTTTGTYTTTPGGTLTGLPNGTALAYNAAQQLTATTRAGSTTATYQYDANGNRTRTTTPATALTPAQITSYRYNSAGSLTGVTRPDTTTTDYTTNGAGLRATRTHNGTTTHFTWADANDMPLILDDGTHRYLYGPDLTPYAQINTNGTIHYLHTDNIGSVRLITDHTGTVTGTNAYDPYGNRTHHTGTDSRIGFTGAWTDPTTGLIHLRARDYDPTTGQFLTIDPIADSTHQPYAYAENNPLQNTDPSGLCTDCTWLDKKFPNFAQGLRATEWALADALLFGLPSKFKEFLQPGSTCDIKNNPWYRPVLSAGTAASMVIPGKGALSAATAAGYSVRAIAASRPGPKLFGIGAHNRKVREVADSVEDGIVVGGGQRRSSTGEVLREAVFQTPKGSKSSRRPDILVNRPDGTQYGINVGKQYQRTGAPVKRESEAINDLEEFANLEMHFVPYNGGPK